MSRTRSIAGIVIAVVVPIVNFFATLWYVASLPPPSTTFHINDSISSSDSGASTTVRILFLVVPFVAGLVGAALVRSWLFFGVMLAVLFITTLATGFVSSFALLVVAPYCLSVIVGVAMGTTIGVVAEFHTSETT